MAEETNVKYKVLFVYDHKYPDLWKDGLWAALDKLEEKFATVTKVNLAKQKFEEDITTYDFILGWGGFNSPVDTCLQLLRQTNPHKIPYGLCLAGNAFPLNQQKYEVIFYETDWTKQWLFDTAKSPVPNIVHAFGYNSSVYHTDPYEQPGSREIDYLTVGAFSAWKRQDKLLKKDGLKMAIGEIQEGNLTESMGIIAPLLMGKVIVSDMMNPFKLAYFYRRAKKVYIPADLYGGGERAVMEAQACGAKIEIEDDNPKLKELIGKLLDENYYEDQLETGIEVAIEFQDEN